MSLANRFAREKEQILSQYILHHDISENQVVELSERLDLAVDTAVRLHSGQKRKSGEDYVIHPIRTAIQVSRFGRIVDWPSIEASILHDTLEDTPYTDEEIIRDFPASAKLVQALTKIKDSRELTYQKLFRYVLKDIRVLLVKLADRLDNLETLDVFPAEKRKRIASESAQMYANICRRLCMMELADRLSEKVGQYLIPEEFERYNRELEAAKETLAKPLTQLRLKLGDTFPGDLGVRIEMKWNRFTPEMSGFTDTTHFHLVRIITETAEDAYRALGRVHITFKAIPGSFTDTISNPRTNGYKALETAISYRGRIVNFYIANRSADRYNRLGLLSMDIDSPEFNLKYLEDLREFLHSSDGNIQDFMRFQKPDAIQVVSPKGEIFALEEGATALDFAFAVHNELGLRATGAKINEQPATLDEVLHSGDRVRIETAPAPVCDERYLEWAHSRKALTTLRRYLKKVEMERAATTGRQWLLEAARAEGVPEEEALALAQTFAHNSARNLSGLFADICLGAVEIGEILLRPTEPRIFSVETLVRMLRPARSPGSGEERKVRRYDFDDPHIRFCHLCIPLPGDEIEGAPEAGRLNVHRKGCQLAAQGARIPLTWDRGKNSDLRDPGPIEMEIEVQNQPGAFYAVMWPFKTLSLDIQEISMPGEDGKLKLRFSPTSARTLDKLLAAMRKVGVVRAVRLMRDVMAGYPTPDPSQDSPPAPTPTPD